MDYLIKQVGDIFTEELQKSGTALLGSILRNEPFQLEEFTVKFSIPKAIADALRQSCDKTGADIQVILSKMASHGFSTEVTQQFVPKEHAAPKREDPLSNLTEMMNQLKALTGALDANQK